MKKTTKRIGGSVLTAGVGIAALAGPMVLGGTASATAPADKADNRQNVRTDSRETGRPDTPGENRSNNAGDNGRAGDNGKAGGNGRAGDDRETGRPAAPGDNRSDKGEENGKTGKTGENGKPATDGGNSRSGTKGGSSDSHDPRGSHGTVKIDGLPLQGGTRNEPHVACGFAVDFFNFGAGQKADIAITGQAPSGNNSHTLLSRKDVVISDDAAGGAKNDQDATLRYGMADLDMGTMKAHDKQGFHVKVTVTIQGEQGAGKHKVFWMKGCTTTETPATPDTKTPETPDTKTPHTKTPAIKTPDTKTPDTKTPDTKTPEAKTPEAKTPGDAPSPVPTTPTTPTSDDPTVPSGGVEGGFGGGLGAGDGGAPAGWSLPMMLLAGAASMGLGLAVAIGRRFMLNRIEA